MKRSKSTVVNSAITSIDSRIRSVFNSEIFGLYEGIIEKIDTENGSLNVRIPAIANTLYEDCRIMTLCSTETSAILPNFEINAHVIVGFMQFNLANPIIMGQISSVTASTVPYEEGTLVFKNGNCGLKITDAQIDLSNSKGSISVTDSGITITNESATVLVSGSEIKIDCPGIVTIKGPNGITVSGGDIALTGGNITSNGEDLNTDDVGVI